MTPRHVLREASEVIARDHCAAQLAVNAAGARVRPADPAAVAWTVVGAVGKVACPSPDAPGWMPLTQAGEDAIGFLYEAADFLGAHKTLVVYDAWNAEARALLFRRAISLAEQAEEAQPRPRARVAAGTGNRPRGVEAA